MGNDPKVKIEMTSIDIILEALGWALLVVQIVFAFVVFPQLPEKIPSHFNNKGIIDGYSSKISFFILPGITGIIMILLTGVNAFPNSFNYPVKVTEENRVRQYTLAIRLLRVMKFSLAAIFLGITIYIYYTATGKLAGLGKWFLPISLCVVFVPVVVYAILAFRNRK